MPRNEYVRQLRALRFLRTAAKHKVSPLMEEIVAAVPPVQLRVDARYRLPVLTYPEDVWRDRFRAFLRNSEFRSALLTPRIMYEGAEGRDGGNASARGNAPSTKARENISTASEASPFASNWIDRALDKQCEFREQLGLSQRDAFLRARAWLVGELQGTRRTAHITDSQLEAFYKDVIGAEESALGGK